MDLIDLELVVHVAEAGSITHGASRAHLTLPSASARIRALERATGATLFDRDRRGVTPTPAGTLLLRHARTIGQAVDHLHTELAEFAEGHSATVRVLANTGATTSLLDSALTTFLAAHPKVRIDLEERPSHRIVAAVAERRAELGIVADTVDLGRLDTRPLPSRNGSPTAASSQSPSTIHGPPETSSCVTPPRASSPKPHAPCATTSPPPPTEPNRVRSGPGQA